MKVFLLIVGGVVLLLGVGLVVARILNPAEPILHSETYPVESKDSHDNTRLANPASEFCAENGGTVSIREMGNGGQYGLCEFEGDQACEEWAMYRGECPIGGVKTIGYDNVEQSYCAWVGGSTLAVANAQCTLPDGTTCGVNELYMGECPENKDGESTN